MAITRDELSSYSFKSLLGVLGSGNKLSGGVDEFAYYEESFASRQLVLPDQILAEYNSVLEAATYIIAAQNAIDNPSILKNFDTTNAIHCTPSSNGKAFFLTETYNNLSSRLYNFILPQSKPLVTNGLASTGYVLRFFNSDPANGGVEISTTQGQDGALVGWFPVYGAGSIITSSDFIGITDVNDVWATAFQYIGATGSDSSSEFVEKLYKTYSCEASALVGDLVHLDSLTDNKVLVNISNVEHNITIGIIEEKLTNTSCRVVISGSSLSTYSNISRGQKVFLGIDGKPTSTSPSSGYIQTLGFCDRTDRVYLNIDYNRVKRN